MKKVMLGSQNPSLAIINESSTLAWITLITMLREAENVGLSIAKNHVTPNRLVETFMESHLIRSHKKTIDIRLLDKDNQP